MPCIDFSIETEVHEIRTCSDRPATLRRHRTRFWTGKSHVRFRGQFQTSPVAPRGELCPLGEMFTPSFTPRGEHSVAFRRMEG
jgi:hypothetical protein